MENKKFSLPSNHRNSIILASAPAYDLDANDNEITMFNMNDSGTGYNNKGSFQNLQESSDRKRNKLVKTQKPSK